jgi:hypothetical protein
MGSDPHLNPFQHAAIGLRFNPLADRVKEVHNLCCFLLGGAALRTWKL